MKPIYLRSKLRDSRAFFPLLHVVTRSHLQRELWSLRGSLQDLLPVAGLQHRGVPLLRITVRGHEVREALRTIESV